MRAFVTASILSFIIVAVLSVWGISYLIEKKVSPIIADHIEAEHSVLASYFEDIQFLREQKVLAPLFQTSSLDPSQGQSKLERKPEKDAGIKLNSMLKWLPSPQAGFSSASMVPEDIQDLILRLGPNWPLHTSPFGIFFDRKRVNLKIFENLQGFTYWDIEKNGPVAELIKNRSVISTESLPIVDPLELIALSKLRYIEAVFGEDYLDALKDVRKLIDLLLTTENYRLELTAIAILEAEHSAVVLYQENEWIKPEDWQPVNSNVTRRANRALKFAKGALRFWTPIADLEKIYLAEQAPIGFCGVVGDTLAIEFGMRNSMATQLAFENDFERSFLVLDKIYERAKKSCRLDYSDFLSGHKLLSRLAPPIGFLGGLPYTRKLFGLAWSANHFDGFKDYVGAPTESD